MSGSFYKHLFEQQQQVKPLPPNAVISGWASSVINLLYPEHSGERAASADRLEMKSAELQKELCSIICVCCNEMPDAGGCVAGFFEQLPELYRVLNTDIEAIYAGDPAAISKFEVVRTYPGFYAICFYRIAHLLTGLGVPVIPRILTEHAHSVTGIDIHPSAIIGEYFHIDHGTGIVIGETCTIGRHVKMYQGVTLGALSVQKSMAGMKRHPTVQDRVVIYSGASILGGDTVIGHDSVIGGNVWITESIRPHSTVYHTPMIRVQNIVGSDEN